MDEHTIQKRQHRRDALIEVRDRLVPLLRSVPGCSLRAVDAARRIDVASQLVVSVAQAFPSYVQGELDAHGYVARVTLHPHLAPEAICTTAEPAATRRTRPRRFPLASIPTTASRSSTTTPPTA